MEGKQMKKKQDREYIKFDARPHMNVKYFPNTQDGIYAVHKFWHDNWLIGVNPKVTLVYRKNK